MFRHLLGGYHVQNFYCRQEHSNQNDTETILIIGDKTSNADQYLSIRWENEQSDPYLIVYQKDWNILLPFQKVFEYLAEYYNRPIQIQNFISEFEKEPPYVAYGYAGAVKGIQTRYITDANLIQMRIGCQSISKFGYLKLNFQNMSYRPSINHILVDRNQWDVLPYMNDIFEILGTNTKQTLDENTLLQQLATYGYRLKSE